MSEIKIRNVKDGNGNIFYPLTHISAVTGLDGYLCKGVATTSTNPGTPMASTFYFAMTSGTYTNFLDSSSQALVVTSGINILKYDVSNPGWSLDQLWGVDSAPTSGSNNLITSGGVYTKEAQQDQTISNMQTDITKATFINMTQEAWDALPDADKDPNRYYAIYED